MLNILAQLHGLKIAHGDISLENFIMDNDNSIRIIDFGMSIISSRSNFFCLHDNLQQLENIRLSLISVAAKTVYYSLLCRCYHTHASTHIKIKS